MLVEPEIDKDKLKSVILNEYGINITNLNFLPKGEVSFGYISESSDSKRYFIKLLGNSRIALSVKGNTEIYLQLCDELINDLGIKNISHAIKTTSGNLTTTVDDFLLIIYPLIDGETFNQNECSEETFIKLVQLIAKIHKSTSKIQTKIPTEDFDISFIGELQKALQALENFQEENKSYKGKLAKLLIPKKQRLEKHMTELIEYQEKVLNSSQKLVLTHSDLTAENLMIDKKGEVYIIDWEAARIAPPESDIRFFLSRLNLFMSEYQKIHQDIKLNKDIFAFYLYKRYLDDLNDWVLRILYENTSDDQNEGDLHGVIHVCMPDIDGIEQKLEKLERN